MVGVGERSRGHSAKHCWRWEGHSAVVSLPRANEMGPAASCHFWHSLSSCISRSPKHFTSILSYLTHTMSPLWSKWIFWGTHTHIMQGCEEFPSHHTLLRFLPLPCFLWGRQVSPHITQGNKLLWELLVVSTSWQEGVNWAVRPYGLHRGHLWVRLGCDSVNTAALPFIRESSQNSSWQN